MLNWLFKSKEKPKFWNEYLASFHAKKSSDTFVVFDCESTGLHLKKDRILSIGAVVIENDKILVSKIFSVFLQQDIYNASSVPIHGILKEGTDEKNVEVEAIIQFLDFIKNATLVGHHVSFDIGLINESLSRIGLGRLKNQYMDTDIMYQKLKHLPVEQHTSLDELCDVYKIRKSERHTAIGDAFITAILFLKLKKKLSI